jgi:2-polyprenyl-3-methyl-5-hydroxy-6-metoxy-1,4-benzoquinol methylase
VGSENLEERRRHASDVSLGLSDVRIYEAFEKLVSPQAKNVLDFGAGRGEFAKRLAARFAEVTAIDLMERPSHLPLQIQWIKADLNHELRGQDARYDLVVAVEVIEHLENPRAVVRTWHKLLRPGGRLLFSTPNNESVRALAHLLARGHYVEFGDGSYPAHITALLKKDMERILREENFGDISFHYTNHGAVPKLTRFTWQQISGGLLKGRRFSDNIVVSAMKAPS